MEYLIPAADAVFEEEIKKSRFITYLRHTEGLAQAKAFWAEIKALHPQARHHCWATVAGRPNDSQQYGFSDDGEPSGTAGKPMLNYLIGSNVGEISAVVVRYYGGILLGTGGLVRAYGNGVQQALQQLTTIRKVLRKSYRLQCSYDQFNDVQHLLSRYDIEMTDQQFAEQVTLCFGIVPSDYATLQNDLTQRFAARVNLEKNE